MNRAALMRAKLTLRVIPPRAGYSLFPVPPDYDSALSAIQQLRGARYVADGAILETALDSQGRHITDEDKKSYHITLSNGDMQGCLRVQLYMDPTLSFTEYRVYDLVRRMPAREAERYHAAIEQFVHNSLQNNYGLGETGGWVVSQQYRANIAAMGLPIAGWSLSRILLRQTWIAAATERNGSAEMLRRIGGWRIRLDGDELPPFYDFGYNCRMELLCFASDIINPKFESAVRDLQSLIEDQSILSNRIF